MDKKSFSSPYDVFDACVNVEFAGEDEEIVAEAVDVCEYVVVECWLLVVGCWMLVSEAVGEAKDAAFSASAYGAAYVSIGCATATARKNEKAQWRNNAIQAVDLSFYCLDHLWRNDIPGTNVTLCCVCSKIATNDE